MQGDRHPSLMIKPELRESLLGSDGEDLCRLLREVYLAVETHGFYRAPAACRQQMPMLRLAQELELICSNGNQQFKLTSIGYQFGNIAKEYCNWLDACRPLPPGVCADEVAGRRVVDVGCGFGRHLFAYAASGARSVQGVEPQALYRLAAEILAARERLPAQTILDGTATDLPLPDGQADLVVCRLVMMYVPDVKQAFGEFRRVLASGGRLILVYPLFGGLCRQLVAALRIRNPRAVLWNGFALVNTLCMELTGQQLRIRKPGRMHSVHSPNYPTSHWVVRNLSAEGFHVDRPVGRYGQQGTFKAIRK